MFNSSLQKTSLDRHKFEPLYTISRVGLDSDAQPAAMKELFCVALVEAEFTRDFI